MKRVRITGMRGLVAEATELGDSPAPVLFCDPDLIVSDMNRAAAEGRAANYLGKNLRENLTPDGVVELKALIKFKRRVSVVPIVRTHDFSYAVATASEYFGVVFAALRLYENRRSMMRDRDVRALICPEFEVSLSDDDVGGALRDTMYIKNEVGRIYDVVKEAPPSAIDLLKTLRTLVREGARYGVDPSLCALSLPVSEYVVIPTADDRTAVKTVAVALSVAADIASDGALMIRLEKGEDEAKIVFSAKATPTSAKIVGDRHPELLGKEFPRIGARGRILFYLCSVCGIGCAYTVEKGKRFELTLTFRKGGVTICSVKHGDVFDAALTGETEQLIKVLRRLEKCAE